MVGKAAMRRRMRSCISMGMMLQPNSFKGCGMDALLLLLVAGEGGASDFSMQYTWRSVACWLCRCSAAVVKAVTEEEKSIRYSQQQQRKRLFLY